MFVRYFFSKNNQFFTRSGYSLRHFSNNAEKPKESQTSRKKEMEIVITPKRLFVGAVLLSWVYILKKWIDAEETGRIRAQEYYDKGGSVDVNLPEEYRKEYVKLLFCS